MGVVTGCSGTEVQLSMGIVATCGLDANACSHYDLSIHCYYHWHHTANIHTL